jgi:hypothetical protein
MKVHFDLLIYYIVTEINQTTYMKRKARVLLLSWQHQTYICSVYIPKQNVYKCL